MNSMNGFTPNRDGKNSSTGRQKDIIPKGYKKAQIGQYTPEQMELFKNQFQNVGPESYLSRLAGGDEELYNEMEAPALRQFGQLQGQLASRFSGAGGLGARRSSGFQQAANQQGSDFAQQLQSQRQSLQRNALNDLMSFSNQLLQQRPYETSLAAKPEKEMSTGSKFGLAGLKLLGNAPEQFAQAFAGG